MKTVVDIENWLTYQVKLANEVVMDFKVFEQTSQGDDGPEYDIKGSPGMEWTPDLDKAEELCSGMLKWDGCINVDFQSLHFCDNPGEKFKAVFDQLYTLGAELMGDKIDYTVPTSTARRD